VRGEPGTGHWHPARPGIRAARRAIRSSGSMLPTSADASTGVTCPRTARPPGGGPGFCRAPHHSLSPFTTRPGPGGTGGPAPVIHGHARVWRRPPARRSTPVRVARPHGATKITGTQQKKKARTTRLQVGGEQPNCSGVQYTFRQRQWPFHTETFFDNHRVSTATPGCTIAVGGTSLWRCATNAAQTTW
jgi:hypothetical protein